MPPALPWARVPLAVGQLIEVELGGRFAQAAVLEVHEDGWYTLEVELDESDMEESGSDMEDDSAAEVPAADASEPLAGPLAASCSGENAAKEAAAAAKEAAPATEAEAVDMEEGEGVLVAEVRAQVQGPSTMLIDGVLVRWRSAAASAEQLFERLFLEVGSRMPLAPGAELPSAQEAGQAMAAMLQEVVTRCTQRAEEREDNTVHESMVQEVLAEIAAEKRDLLGLLGLPKDGKQG